MLKIGLTGGIGSGKTTVAKIFQTLNIPVFDADSVAKNILNEDAQLREKIIQLFGEGVYNNGLLDRKIMAEIVFNDIEKLEQLNALVHPATIEAGNRWMQKQLAPYAIKEAALIFEAGVYKYLDYVIGVTAPEDLRIQRVIQRDNTDYETVVARLKKQMPDKEKMQLCNFVIYNDEKQLLIPQVIDIHNKIISL